MIDLPSGSRNIIICVIIWLIVILGTGIFMGYSTPTDYRSVCEKTQGIPAYNGKNWECLKEMK